MHNKWEEMVPFYVANTLPIQQVRALESHLSGCESCRQSLDQWRMIARAVKEEALDQSRGLPPLSAQVRRTIATIPARADGSATRKRNVEWRSSLVAIAAAAAIILAAGILITFMTRSARPIEQGSSVVGVSTATAEATERPTQSGTAESGAGATATPGKIDFGILSPTPAAVAPEATARSSTDTRPTTAPQATSGTPSTGFSPMTAHGNCMATNAGSDLIAIYSLPRSSADVIAYLPGNTGQDIFATDGTGWYEIYSTAAGRLGWVSGESITLDGSCADLMLPTPTLPGTGGSFCVVRSIGSTVNMYAGPGPGYSILNAFSPEQRLTATLMADNGWYRVNLYVGSVLWQGWVSPDLVTVEGMCGLLTVVSANNYPAELPPDLSIPPDEPTWVPTPTAGYDANLRAGGYSLVTLTDVGSIPAGSTVAISSARYNGSSRFYGIYDQNGKNAEDVPESQLAPAPANNFGS